MPFGEYNSMEDCISKNQQAENPGAYCAQIHKDITGKWPSEAYRHPDFEKIYKQFLTREDGENRYHEWVQALNLDETKPYGQSQKEQFRWVRRHVDFNLWKEDTDAKYWQVEAGFPLESMNMNVYSEQELIESARTIEGKMVNVNHKFQLPTVDIVAGKWEDGVVESVLRVPKQLRCPVCSEKKTVNDLIESNGIVNVSLEAVCTLESDDPNKCEGMKFTGLALLTKDTLPGIPLTRLMPLEHIMVEALQTSSTTKEKRKMKKKLRLEVLEDVLTPEEIKAKIKDLLTKRQELEAEHDKESTAFWDEYDLLTIEINALENALAAIMPLDVLDVGEKKIWEDTKQFVQSLKAKREQVTQVVPVSGEPVEPGTEPDEHGQCPEGKMINALGKCVAIESCPEAQHWSAEANDGHGGCVPDTVPVPETPETAVGTSPAPHEDVLTMGPTEQPTPEEQPPVTGTKKIPSAPAAGEQPAVTGDSPEGATSMKPTAPGDIKPKPSHTCPDGQHHDYNLDQCVPNEPITERIKRFKAEDKANKLEKNVQFLTATWEKRYGDLDKTNHDLLNDVKHYRTEIVDLKTELRTAHDKRNDAVVDLRELKIQYATTDNLLKKAQLQIEELRTSNATLAKKYHATLATNLELSQKITKGHEDYLEVHGKLERTEEALKRTKIKGKQIVKMRV